MDGSKKDEEKVVPQPKQRRGFAAMSADKQREIASMGGKASHAKGTGYEWNSESARAAGIKGGMASHKGSGKKPAPMPEEHPAAHPEEGHDG